ncbi:hypothetical protein PRNP1_009450 [Phytophthora ramorum]
MCILMRLGFTPRTRSLALLKQEPRWVRPFAVPRRFARHFRVTNTLLSSARLSSLVSDIRHVHVRVERDDCAHDLWLPRQLDANFAKHSADEWRGALGSEAERGSGWIGLDEWVISVCGRCRRTRSKGLSEDRSSAFAL